MQSSLTLPTSYSPLGKMKKFNEKLASLITRGVGSMACAYIFGLIALISLPSAIASHSVITIVSWVAQTFLQLVLLSVIMVGQRVQSEASERRTVRMMKHMSKEIDGLYSRICK